MPTAMTVSSYNYNSKYECHSVTVKTFFFFDFYSFDVKRLNNIIVLFKFFFRYYLFYPKM